MAVSCLCEGSLLFHKMPLSFRLKVVKKHLAAPAWFTKQAIVGHVELNVSTTVEEVQIRADRVHLRVENSSGSRWIETDHVIAATGYKVDLQRLSFLSSRLQTAIRSVEHAPVLSHFIRIQREGAVFRGSGRGSQLWAFAAIRLRSRVYRQPPGASSVQVGFPTSGPTRDTRIGTATRRNSLSRSSG